jgi:excisionase family DNA binding protein
LRTVIIVPPVRRSLSPRDLAAAIGVSESSLKRWVDEGRVRATRTEGGHRRISMADAIRFIREGRHPVVRPDLLGLPRLPRAEIREAGALYQHLRAGDAAATRALLLARYLEGESVAAICDGPIREALEPIGELWKDSAEGIFIEHRASDLCLQTLAELRATLVAPPGAPVAIGCAPSGDSHMLPSFMAATVLTAAGLAATNLGADLPAAALDAAIAHHQPALIWISVSMPIAADAGGALARLLDRAAARCAVIVGGRHAGTLPVTAPRVRRASTMTELDALARAL